MGSRRIEPEANGVIGSHRHVSFSFNHNLACIRFDIDDSKIAEPFDKQHLAREMSPTVRWIDYIDMLGPNADFRRRRCPRA